jgi:hypothetical protein
MNNAFAANETLCLYLLPRGMVVHSFATDGISAEERSVLQDGLLSGLNTVEIIGTHTHVVKRFFRKKRLNIVRDNADLLSAMTNTVGWGVTFGYEENLVGFEYSARITVAADGKWVSFYFHSPKLLPTALEKFETALKQPNLFK